MRGVGSVVATNGKHHQSQSQQLSEASQSVTANNNNIRDDSKVLMDRLLACGEAVQQELKVIGAGTL